MSDFILKAREFIQFKQREIVVGFIVGLVAIAGFGLGYLYRGSNTTPAPIIIEKNSK